MRIPTMLKSKNMSFPISHNKTSAITEITDYSCLSSSSPRNTRRRLKNIARRKIEEIAIEKYKASGHGLNFKDVMEDFHLRKRQAQTTLKNLHNKGVFFTPRDLFRQGIYLTENKRPQEYFPSCIKAEILENLKKKKSVNSNSSEIIPFQKFAIAAAMEYQRAQNFLEALLLLTHRSLHIHRLLLVCNINRQFYSELREIKGIKKIEKYEDIIGRRHVKFTISSNGTIQIAVKSNDTPFKLETEQDISIIFTFFGQVRDRLLSLLGDPKELLVPSVMEWVLKQCDLNKDIEIDEKAQLTLPDIQLTNMDRVFRQYVKIREAKAYYRIEESLKLNEILPMALDNIIHPNKSLEKKVEELARSNERLNQKIDAVIKVNPKIEIGNQEYQQYNELCRLASNSDDNNGMDNGRHT